LVYTYDINPLMSVNAIASGKSRGGVLLSTHNEVNMAKRRNQKKEKALRNQAYARKFRKRATTAQAEEDEDTAASN
jgi:hypothetical protein